MQFNCHGSSIEYCCTNYTGPDYEEIRNDHPVETFVKVFTFNSARKSMSTVIPLNTSGDRMFTKGASEIILDKCSYIVKENGRVVPLTPADHREIISSVVQPMASRALRTIALAYRYVCVFIGGIM